MTRRSNTAQVIETAELLVEDLMTLGRTKQIPPRDLLIVVAMAERLLQSVLCANDWERVHQIMQEADATLEAVTTDLEIN